MEKETQNKNPNAEMLNDIYKGVTMGIDGIIALMPKVRDENFRSDITTQLNQYQAFANEAAKRLCDMGCSVPKTNYFSKATGEISAHFETIGDDSVSKLAEIMINGSTMGVINLCRRVSKAKNCPELAQNSALASDIVKFEEQNIERLKTYL